MEERRMDFDIRYAILDSDLIFSSCGLTCSGPIGWTEELIEQRQKNIEKNVSDMNIFLNKLEESILKDGFRNPILIRSGWVPDRIRPRIPLEMQNDPSKILVCHSSGGSRLWVAQKHRLEIPCIIMDYIGRFSNETLVEKTNDSVLEFFEDVPQNIVINDVGLGVSNLPQVGEF